MEYLTFPRVPLGAWPGKGDEGDVVGGAGTPLVSPPPLCVQASCLALLPIV